MASPATAPEPSINAGAAEMVPEDSRPGGSRADAPDRAAGAEFPAARVTARHSTSRPSLLAVLAFFAVLYVGRELFLPIVLAALLSFLLAPAVKWLERVHFPRLISVVLVTLSVFAVIGGLTFILGKQVTDLAAQLPAYKANLLEKVAALKLKSDNPLTRALHTIQEVAAEAQKSIPQKAPERDPVPKVEIIPPPPAPLENLAAWLRPVAAPLGQAAVVVVLVVFMLLGREDVRDRMIHLAGRGRLRLTTQTLNDAGRRVSRYLIAETALNFGYAIVIGTGLYLIGLPNALLWGMMCGMLRFLPYVGPWLGASGPILLSLAVSESWQLPLMVCTLFVVIELVGNNFVEPWVYGASTGLYPLAIIVSALFWTWLWGALGLVLATPLTVCAMVIGQHVPRLRFLDVLLSRQAPIATADRVYQRLLAFDSDEVLEIVETEGRDRSLAEAFDRTMLPALRAEEVEFNGGLMPVEDRERIFTILRALIAALGDANHAEAVGKSPILCLPATDEADELAALMLEQALRAHGMVAEVPSHRQLIAEMVSLATEKQSPVIVVTMVAPAAALAGVSLCHRLRAALPESFIVAGAWLASDEFDERLRARLEKAGASMVCPTLERVVAALTAVAPLAAGLESDPH